MPFSVSKIILLFYTTISIWMDIGTLCSKTFQWQQHLLSKDCEDIEIDTGVESLIFFTTAYLLYVANECSQNHVIFIWSEHMIPAGNYGEL